MSSALTPKAKPTVKVKDNPLLWSRYTAKSEEEPADDSNVDSHTKSDKADLSDVKGSYTDESKLKVLGNSRKREPCTCGPGTRCNNKRCTCKQPAPDGEGVLCSLDLMEKEFSTAWT